MKIPKDVTPDMLNAVEELLNRLQASLTLKNMKKPLTENDIKMVFDGVRYQLKCEVEEGQGMSKNIWLLTGEDNCGKRHNLGYCSTKEEMLEQVAILAKTYFWVTASKVKMLGE